MAELSVGLIHNVITPYRVTLFDALADRDGIDLTVYYCSETHSNRNWDIELPDGHQFEILPGVSIDNGWVSFKIHVNPGIVRRLRTADHDAVVIAGTQDITNQLGYATARAMEIPIVYWSEQFGGGQSLLNKLYYPLKRRIICGADSLVVSGKRAKAFHVEMDADPDDIHFAPNVIDNETYLESAKTFGRYWRELKAAHGMQGKTVLLYVGGLVERKGLEYLFEAYDRLRAENNDVALIVVGEGELLGRLESFVTKNNLEDVLLTGWVSETQKRIFYAMADLFVLPATEDTAPLVLNEALASGLPIVTTDAVGSAVDFVPGDDNGVVIEAGDTDALYKALSSLTSSSTDLNELGRNSQRLLNRKFTIERSVDGFVSAIEQATPEL